MTPTTHPAVTEYLRAVERALAGIPSVRRDEIVADLREHVDASLAEYPAADEAQVRTVLDRLGSPADIAAEATARFGVTIPQKPPRRILELSALALVSAGSLVFPIVGWVAGIVLVWASGVWRTGEKMLATLLFPFGMMPAIIVLYIAGGPWGATCASTNGEPQVCTGGASTLTLVLMAAVFLASLLGPVVTVAVLGRRLRRTEAAL